MKRSLTLTMLLLITLIIPILAQAQLAAKKQNIGIQLYSARTLMTNVPEALNYLSGLGFSTLETYGYNNGKLFGLDAKEFVNLAHTHGLTVTSSHLRIPYNADDLTTTMAQWEKVINEHAALGFKYLVIPSHTFGTTIESLDQCCEYFNAVGKLVKEKGMTLCYHNDKRGMNLVEGISILEYLIMHTSTDVFFELDILWATEGGLDPKELLKKYPEKIALLHLSDKDVTGASGEIDIEGVVKQFYANGKNDFYVEVERYGNYEGEEALRLSAEFVMNSSFVK